MEGSSVTALYAEEIRSWLLGRLSSRMISGSIPKQAPTNLSTPITLWWMFEGRRYDGLDGRLATEWTTIDRWYRRLLRTYNPHWRQVDYPEGEIDWLASAAASLAGFRATFVAKASIAGLGDEQRSVLIEWLKWIRQQWQEYVRDGVPQGCSEALPWTDMDSATHVAPPDLRWWAHVARRSRWPLLRNVVAETCRCFLEPTSLDSLPLPSTRSSLFELLCIVRLLRYFQEHPRHVRWLDHETGNCISVGGLRVHYQHAFSVDGVIETSEFTPPLRRALRRHGILPPSRADAWLEFDAPWLGFAGILLEAKSGSQDFDSTVYQLKVYRAALGNRVSAPILVLGVIEDSADTKFTPLLERREFGEDTWIFCTGNQIGTALDSVRKQAVHLDPPTD